MSRTFLKAASDWRLVACRDHQFGRLLHIENANLRIKVLKLRAARDHVRGMDTVFTAINRKQNFHIGSF